MKIVWCFLKKLHKSKDAVIVSVIKYGTELDAPIDRIVICIMQGLAKTFLEESSKTNELKRVKYLQGMSVERFVMA